jgi:hypothetical protein
MPTPAFRFDPWDRALKSLVKGKRMLIGILFVEDVVSALVRS